MPRIVPASQREYAIRLMVEEHKGQREIERLTGLSRPYLRRLAAKIGYQFPRNGIEVLGTMCMCTNCGSLFRRPPSKLKKTTNVFCDNICKVAWSKGANHPAWKTGSTVKSFSDWVKNQAAYDTFRNAVLERDGHKCVISGRSDNLEVHHVFPKAEGINPEKAFDPTNGITLCADVHQEIHSLISRGVGFDDAIEQLRNKYQEQFNVENK